MAQPRLSPPGDLPRRQLPLDPVVAINRQASQYDSAQREAMGTVLQRLIDAEPDYIRDTPKPDIERRLVYEADKLVKASGVSEPKSLGNMPGLGLQNSLLETGAELPQRALTSILNLSGAPNDPSRIENTPDLLDLQAPLDMATGRMPDLQDAGNTARSYLPAVLAFMPQLKGAKGLLGLGKHLESYLAATAGAGVAGGVGTVLDEAAKYQRENDNPIDALSKATAEVTYRDVVLGSLSAALFEQLTTGATVGNTALREKVITSLGVGSDEVSQWLDDAARFNIDLSLQNVSTSDVVRRLPQSVGRFPALNTQFAENITRPGAQIRDAFSQTFYGIAPVLRDLTKDGPLQQNDRALAIALNTFNAAEKSFSIAEAKHARLYGAFYDEAKATGTVVRPVNGEIEAAIQRKKLNSAIKKETEEPTGILDAAGNMIKRWVKSDRKPTGDIARANKALDDLLDSPEKYPSVEDFQGTVRRLQAVVDQVGSDTQAGAAVISVIDKLRKDFEDNLVGPDSVKAAKKAADTYYKESVAIFGGRLGNLVRQIDTEYGTRRLSDPLTGAKLSLGDRSGSEDPMAIIDQVFSNGGNDTIQDLYRIFTRSMGGEGDRLFREAYGLHLTRAIDQFTKQASPKAPRITDTKGLRSFMGLDDINGPKFGATAKALELSGVNVVDFMKMLDLSDQVFQFGVPDVSQLITRRVMLGGLGSGARTYAPVKGLFGTDKKDGALYQFIDGVASSAAFFYLAAGQAKKLTDPRVLKAYTALIDPKAPLSVRIRSARRLALLDTSFLAWNEVMGNDPTQIKPGDSRAVVNTPLPGSPPAVPYPTNLPAGVR